MVDIPTVINKLKENLARNKYTKKSSYVTVQTIKRLEQGLCDRCGKQPYREGHKSCGVCAAQQTKEAIKRRKRRISRGQCERCFRPATKGKVRCSRCNRLAKKSGRLLRESARNEVYAGYGRKCACCGLTDQRFLSLDHVNNDGWRHRKKLYGNRVGATIAMYRWAVRSGFPRTLQLLCFNCNMGKNRNGGICPHEQDRLNETPTQPAMS